MKKGKKVDDAVDSNAAPDNNTNDLSEKDHLPMGHFQIELGVLSARPETTNVSGSVWAHVDLVVQKQDKTEGSSEIWWTSSSSSEEDQKTNVDKYMTEILHLTTGGSDPQFNFQQLTKPFILTSEQLSSIHDLSIRITLYNGDARDPEVDTVLGCANVAILSMLSTGTWTDFVSVLSLAENEKDPSERQAVMDLELTLTCNADLAEFTLGNRFLSLRDFQVQNLPTEWQVEFPEGSEELDFQTYLADAENNPATYDLVLTFPCSDLSILKLEQGKLVYRSASLPPPVVDIAAEEEVHESKDEEDPVHQDEQQSGSWTIEWKDQQQLVFLTKPQLNQLQQHQKIQVEIHRQLPSVENHQKMMVTLDCTEMYTPGQTCLTLLAPILPLTLPSREALEAQLAQNDESLLSDEEKKTLTERLENFEAEVSAAQDQAQEFERASTTFSVMCRVNPSMVPRIPTPPKPLQKVSEFIPSRDPLPKFPKQDAEKELQKEIKAIAVTILKEYEKLFHLAPEEDSVTTTTTDDDQMSSLHTNDLPREEKKKKLIYHLNTEGIYHDFKEHLKKNIVQLVHEKFPNAPDNTLGGASVSESKFLTDLYASLMAQVSTGLNQLFSSHDEVAQVLLGPAHEKLSHVEKAEALLLTKAREHEAKQNYDAASKYLLERIAYREDHAHVFGHFDPGVWYDYASFCLERLDEPIRASESLRQCLKTNPDYVPALQLYGAISCELGELQEAEILLKNGIQENNEPETAPERELSHVLLALYYRLSNDASSERYELMMAKNQHPNPVSSVDSCLRAAMYLSKYKLLKSCDHVLVEMLPSVRPSVSLALPPAQRVSQFLIAAANAQHQADWALAQSQAESALALDATCARAWSILGQVAKSQHQVAKAQSCFAQALAYSEMEPDLELVHALAQSYMAESKFQEAQECYTRAAGLHRVNASVWLGIGLAALRLEDWRVAEDALAEANVLNPTDPDVWAYLCLFCLSVTPAREREAQIALDRALAFECDHAECLREIGNALLGLDRLEGAEVVLRRSLAAQDSVSTRRRLADVLAAQNCAESALREYQSALAMSVDDENLEDRCRLLKKCAELFMTLGQTSEAQEYLKMMAVQEQEQAAQDGPSSSAEQVAVEHPREDNPPSILA